MYLLRALQRIIYNKLDKPENEGMPDLSRRELLVLVPLIVLIVWIGVYPAPFLHRVEASAEALVEQVRGPQESFTTVRGTEEGRAWDR
jgi:NADH-quinone oxidoreductase subunit M